MSERMNRNILFFILVVIFCWVLTDNIFARDTAPSLAERRQEEFLLKKQLKPALMEVLKDQYLGMSITIRYVLQHDPIVSQKSKIKRLKLPGFGTQVTITNGPNDVSGYIDKYDRYRTVILIIKTRLSESVQESIARMLKENADIDIGGRDTFDILVLANEKMDLKLDLSDTEKIAEDKDRTEKEKKERLAQLFPELGQPIKPVDSRKEAESSKHLILSRKAYYNNDLNTALNEVIESININPYASKSYEMLGSIYYRLRWNNLALNNWEKALALDPDNKKLGKFISKVKNEL